MNNLNTYAAEPWDGKCQVCRSRPRTVEVHGCPGGLTHECRRCGVEAELASARECSTHIPRLEAELSQIITDESGDP